MDFLLLKFELPGAFRHELTSSAKYDSPCLWTDNKPSRPKGQHPRAKCNKPVKLRPALPNAPNSDRLRGVSRVSPGPCGGSLEARPAAGACPAGAPISSRRNAADMAWKRRAGSSRPTQGRTYVCARPEPRGRYGVGPSCGSFALPLAAKLIPSAGPPSPHRTRSAGLRRGPLFVAGKLPVEQLGGYIQ